MGKDDIAITGRRVAPKSGRERQHRTRRRKQEVCQPFRFLDLPTELRHAILSHAVHSPGSGAHEVLNLFLTCHSIYEQAASIYYYAVTIDTREADDPANGFLSRSMKPRLCIRNLTIRFYLKDELRTFQTVYGPILHTMAEEGNLTELRLEVSYRFPSPSFWGSKKIDIYYDDVTLLAGSAKDREIQAPISVTKAPFQYFLRLLADKRFQTVRLFVDAEDHPQFWCAFHRGQPSGTCGGSWKDESIRDPKLLEIRWKALVYRLLGARVTEPMSSDS